MAAAEFYVSGFDKARIRSVSPSPAGSAEDGSLVEVELDGQALQAVDGGPMHVLDQAQTGQRIEASRLGAPPIRQQPEVPMALGHGTVDNVVDSIVFLASDRARWITGQTLVVDGGWLLR